MGASALHSEGGRLGEQADAQDISSARLLFALSHTEAWDAQNPGPIWFRSVFCFQSVSRMTEGEHMLRIKRTLCIFSLFFFSPLPGCQPVTFKFKPAKQAFWCFPRNVFFNYSTIFTSLLNVFFTNAEHMIHLTRLKCIFFHLLFLSFFSFCLFNILKFLKMFLHDTYFPAVPVVAAGANTTSFSIKGPGNISSLTSSDRLVSRNPR